MEFSVQQIILNNKNNSKINLVELPTLLLCRAAPNSLCGLGLLPSQRGLVHRISAIKLLDLVEKVREIIIAGGGRLLLPQTPGGVEGYELELRLGLLYELLHLPAANLMLNGRNLLVPGGESSARRVGGG